MFKILQKVINTAIESVEEALAVSVGK